MAMQPNRKTGYRGSPLRVRALYAALRRKDRRALVQLRAPRAGSASLYSPNAHRVFAKLHTQWALWCKRAKTVRDREKIMLESVLTQRTNWRNVELAIANLAAASVPLSLAGIFAASRNRKRLAQLVRPAGFPAEKAKRLSLLAGWALRRGGVRRLMRRDAETLREELLSLHGVGPETADDILLYALDKPIFVIDEYTRRIAERAHIAPHNTPYHKLQELFAQSLRNDHLLFQKFHALIVTDGKANGRAAR